MSDKTIELARKVWSAGEVYVGPSEKTLEEFADLVNNDFKERLAQAIEQMPFGDTAASFAQFVRNFK